MDWIDEVLKRLRAKNPAIGWFFTLLVMPLALMLGLLALLLPSLRHVLFEPSKSYQMGYNRIWYTLLWIVVSLGLILTVQFEYDLLGLIYRRWSWAILVSPAAYLFFASLIQAVDLPIRGLRLIPPLFVPDGSPTYSRRYLWTLAVVVGIIMAEVLIQVVLWGSFPLEVDGENFVRLRMIPFIPLPDRPFLAFQ